MRTRERIIVGTGMTLVALATAAYTVHQVGEMRDSLPKKTMGQRCYERVYESEDINYTRRDQ